MSGLSSWAPIVHHPFATSYCGSSHAGALRSTFRTCHSLVSCHLARKRRSPERLSVRADLYRVLHVSPTASQAQISASYRRLARKYHPDVNGSEEASSIYGTIKLAYDILSDSSRRKHYDRFGSGLRGTPGGAGTSEAIKGGDVVTVVTLSFQEAALGKRYSLQVAAKRACPDCVGSGCRPGSRPVFCALCKGTGNVRAHHAGLTGHGMRMVMACPACGATGIVRQEWCTRCGGDGRASSSVTLSVIIPPGVDAESVLKVRGQGDAGRAGGLPGDLYITFLVKASAGMRRRGLDLYSQVVVRYTDAILGVETQVATIHGQAALRIPAGIQDGQVLTMRGAGISPGAAGLASSDGVRQIGAGESQRGAHHFTVIVLLPSQISQVERLCLLQLRELLEADVSSLQGSEPCMAAAE
ncbi:hypothetical protein CVIRNUC_007606 [Coccomyxa viridis]|uniref:Chaperone protein DnaJ n=1 Tax=Coccomyxa viridis TaxID=1274662 RepID=A0AAV1ICF7_9CHLO|nr:hypothetical protein CVIRNUC_007606 [Coccomyxa viridis]